MAEGDVVCAVDAFVADAAVDFDGWSVFGRRVVGGFWAAAADGSGAFGVVDPLETVEPGLELVEGGGAGPGGEPPFEGLVEVFALPLGMGIIARGQTAPERAGARQGQIARSAYSQAPRSARPSILRTSSSQGPVPCLRFATCLRFARG